MADRRPPGLARRSPEESRLDAHDDRHPGHTHRLPRFLLLTLVIIGTGLVVSIGLVSIVAMQANKRAADTNARLERLEGFIAQRGEERDEQYQTLEELIEETDRASICDLLDGLPAGPLLDPKRAERGCGPGVPREELPPEVQDQLQEFAQPDERIPDTAVPDRKTPRRDPQETSDAPAPTSASPAPSVAPDVPTAAPVTPAPTTTAPLVDTNPITEPVCTALGLCF